MDCKAYCHSLTVNKPKLQGRLTQAIRIMRLTGILLFTIVVHVSARTTAQTVTYEARQAPLTQVFSAIEKQTGYVFFYSVQDIGDASPVTVNLKDAPLIQALEQVLAGQSLGFSIRGNTIAIIVKERTSIPSMPEAKAIDVHGRITAEKGEPIEGVSITVKGKNRGTSTNVNGEFTLTEVDAAATIIISSVGYETQEVKLNGRTGLSIQLRLTAASLQDVVVNKGYYSTRQALNTGSVSKVDGTDIQRQPVSDPVMALEGRVPGVYIQQFSGVPGVNNTVRIRGQNSLQNGSDPLYIVDGVPFGSASLTNIYLGGGAAGNPGVVTRATDPSQGLSPFNSLNPSDIESIEVLKDADATAIYGSRGANGVILITTKRGRAGKTRADFNIYSGAGQITRKLNLLNTQQYLQMRHEAFANDNKNPGINDHDINGNWDTTRYTDWQKVLIGNTAHFTNAQVNISGGNINTQFAIGGGYSNQGVVYPGNYRDTKANASFNVTHTTNDQRFRVELNTAYSNDNNNLPNVDLTSQILLAPDAPAIYEANGNLNWQMENGTNTWNNPLSYIFQNNNSTTKLLLSSANFSYSIFTGLKLKTSLGYSYTQMDQKNISPATIVPPPYQSPDMRSVNIANTNRQTWIIEPQLIYNKKIADGALDVLVGTTFQDNSFQSIAYGVSGFANDELISSVTAGTTFSLAGNQHTQYRYNAVFGRIGYNWKEKYLLNITGRRDGSSRFGPGRQFGNFGAAGAGWIFTKEHFIENSLHFLSFGKLRASYGTTGNDNIADYLFLSTYTPVSSVYSGATSLFPGQLTNPYLAWERVNKLEIGIELGFLKDRININADYYRNRSGDQLIGYALPSLTGFSSVEANLPAVIQNKGFEFVLNTIPFRTRNFSWSSTLNITIPETKLISFPDIESSGLTDQYEVGQSLFIKKRFHYTGVNPQTGIYTFDTKNSNGRPSAPDDWINTKPITQQFYGGWQNTFSYIGLRLDIFFQFVKKTGFDYRQSLFQPGTFPAGLSNQPVYVLDRWTKTGDNAQIQKFSTGGTTVAFHGLMKNQSDAPITDASFIRLKNISLSYQLPGNWIQRIHLQNARIYLQCQNLLTITSYKGSDPETGGLNLPPLRMITGGVQFTL